MPYRLESRPSSDPNFYRFAVDIPHGSEQNFRDFFEVLFTGEGGEIIFDQEREAAEKERKKTYEAWLNEKITAFLAPKDPETEAMIGINLMGMFSRIFENRKMTITAFHLGTLEEIRQARMAFHELCSKKASGRDGNSSC